MNKNELLRKLTEYKFGLMKAKIGLLRAGMQDVVSCYDNDIEKVEYAIKQIQMLDESEEKPAEAAKIPEDYWLTVSIFNICRILSDKCDKEMDAMEGMTDKWDKSKYENISKLRTECRRFLTDWTIHDL